MSDILYCDVCDITLSSIYALRKHLKTNLHKKKLNPVQEKFPCLCGRKYTHRPGLYKHRKNCDTYINRPTQEEQKVEPGENEKHGIEEVEAIQEPLLKKIEDLEKKLLEKEIECLKKENESLKKVAVLQKKIEKATKITNNTTNNNNITNNFIINAFGKEDLDIVSIENKMESIQKNYDGVPYIFEMLHCNPEHPENQNIKIKNIREKLVNIMTDNGKWETVDMGDAITDAVNRISDMIYDTYIEHKQQFTDFKRGSFERYNKKLKDDDDKKAFKRVVKNTELVLINSKNK